MALYPPMSYDSQALYQSILELAATQPAPTFTKVYEEIEPPKATHAYRRSYSAMGSTADAIKLGLPKLISLIRQAESYTGCKTVVVRGSSGFAPAAVLALQMPDFCFVMLDKQGVRSHGHSITPIFHGNAMHRFTEYLIMDDFIASGDTMRGIMRDVEAKCKGIVLYGAHQRDFSGLPCFADNCFPY